MRSTSSLVLAGVLFALSSVPALAAGSAGGGVATCTEDKWLCGDWSTCSAQGSQSRSCRMIEDCIAVETPSPATQQSCTPPAPPAPPAPPEPAKTVMPEPMAPPMPNVPMPLATCGEKKTMKERIICRLSESEEDEAYETAHAYMPEECRALATGKRPVCIARYVAFQPCWKERVGEDRLMCARKVLSLGPDVAAQRKSCAAKPVKERQACLSALRDKVYSMVKFRMYDLSEQAEAYKDNAMYKAAVAVFVNGVETAKQSFNKATTSAARTTLVERVRQNWAAFAKLVANGDTNGATLKQALVDLRAVR